MKKLLTITLAVLIAVLALCGCSKGTSSSSTTTATTETTTQLSNISKLESGYWVSTKSDGEKTALHFKGNKAYIYYNVSDSNAEEQYSYIGVSYDVRENGDTVEVGTKVEGVFATAYALKFNEDGSFDLYELDGNTNTYTNKSTEYSNSFTNVNKITISQYSPEESDVE